MIDSTHIVPAIVPRAALPAGSRRTISVLVLGSVAVAVLAGCASDPNEVKKRKPKRYRDPVEQRVFYDGWWPD